MSAVNEQWLVVYVRNGKEHVYSTAYDRDQVRDQMRKCIARWGNNGVRAVLASEYPLPKVGLVPSRRLIMPAPISTISHG